MSRKKRQQPAPLPAPPARAAFALSPWFPLALAAAALIAYANSFSVPFMFDDQTAVIDNENIRRLWPLRRALTGPDQSSVAGRPIINYSLALNYAVSELRPASYHVVNLAIHVAAGLLLYGVIRRTLRSLPGDWPARADALAFASALLWIVHPIQTESVTYIVQRAESIVGLFYLLTLYLFIRGAHAPSPPRANPWFAAAVLACAFGMASKEVMVTAPAVVLLYDWVFVARARRDSLIRRWPVHLAIWATLAILFALMRGGPRSASAGFGISTSTPLDYARAQFEIICRYLRLCFVPYPLVLDYGWPPQKSWLPALPWMAIILALLAATVWALVRRPPLGFLGAWLFMILAPSSTFIPIADLAFEHRMYLPLAAVMTLAVIAADHLLRLKLPDPARRSTLGAQALAAVAALFIILTLARNRDYRTAESIWRDVVRKRPDNPRGHNNLGIVLQDADRDDEARVCFERAIALKPGQDDSHFNLGNAWADLGQLEKAVAEYEEAIRIEPKYWQAHGNLAAVLADLGQAGRGESHARQALAINPNYADGRNNLGTILAQTGRLEEAAREFAAAVALKPDFEEAINNLQLAREQLAERASKPIP